MNAFHIEDPEFRLIRVRDAPIKRAYRLSLLLFSAEL